MWRVNACMCTYVDKHVYMCVCLHIGMLMHTRKQGHFGTSRFLAAEMSLSRGLVLIMLCSIVPLEARLFWLKTRKE